MNSTFTKIVRFLLGIILVIFGFNKFIELIPAPAMPENAANFIKSLVDTGYILPVVGAFEVMIGILLLAKRWVPFALILLAPISLNILLFHLFLDMPGIGGAILVTTLTTIMLYKNWACYKPLFH
jgi:uncharacterized membrane protein YphA (DoxX/SURF4 family)